jgi:uncharacterized protein
MIERHKLKFYILISFSFLISGCASFLYYPSQTVYRDPVKFGLEKEEVYFTDADNNKLHGWWMKSKKVPVKGTVIHFHGNAENLSSHFMSMAWLPGAGYNYFIFDYPGYGESQGKPSPRGNVISGEAALRWVHKNKDQTSLIVYGQSMGGIIALRTVQQMKAEIPIRMMIADSTFDSFQQIARRKLSQHWLTWLFQPVAYMVLSDDWAPDVRQIAPIPLVVMHGEQDGVVDYIQGQEIFAKAGEPKSFIGVPQGQHGNLFWIDDKRYRDVILEKMDAVK